MSDPDGVRWDQIQGIGPGEQLTLTISSKQNDGSVASDIYIGLRGKRKRSGYVEILNFDGDVGEQVTIQINDVERGKERHTVKFHAQIVNGGTSQNRSKVLAVVHRPSMGGYGYKNLSSSDIIELEKELPKRVTVLGMTETGFPFFNYEGYE